MGQKSLEKFNSALVGNLLNEFLFYIPENEITNELITKLENIDSKSIFNKVFIMDKIQGPINYKKDAISKALMKTLMLQENMYLLLKKKRKLDEQEFSFVFNKYFELGEFCFHITNWFHTDLESNTTLKLNKQLNGLFLMQYQGHKNHFEKLVKHFYPKRDSLPTGNFDVLATIEKYFPELIKKYESENKEVIKITKNQIAISNNKATNTVENSLAISTNCKPKEKKKQPQPTQLEVEEFLLRSVFGIKY